MSFLLDLVPSLLDRGTMLSDNTIKAKYSVLAGPALGFGVRGWVRGSRPGQSDHFENKDGKIVHSDAI